MRNWMILTLMLVLSSATAKDEVNIFDLANTLYRQEKYDEAAAKYEMLLRSGMHSPELYFNLANSYYKLNKVAPSIYNYEKALLLSPGDNDIKTNLKFAQKMMVDEVKEIPKVGFKKMLSDFTSMFTYDCWAWIGVGFSVGFLLFFCGYYFSATALSKRIFFVGMFVIAFFMLLSILSAIFEKDRLSLERPAIIFSPIVSIKSEPKQTGADVIVLHEGTKVEILETLDNWARVELPDGSDGWIENTAIKEIK